MEQLEQQLNQGDCKFQNFSTYFIPKKQLGQGSFGKVIQVLDISSQEEIAVKIINKKRMSEQSIQKIKQEALILHRLNHPNIVKFKKLVETNSKILIGMELAKGGSLQELIMNRKKLNLNFSQSEASHIFKSIIEGLAYIHSQNIVHRDLKPENILIDNINDFQTIKIADFGLSQAFSFWSSSMLTKQCGTLLYMAPEFFTSYAYSKQIDLWSCGIILYNLLDSGNHPFYDSMKDSSESFKNKLIQKKQIKYPEYLNKISINLLEKLLALNPSERYSAIQVLQHPFTTRRLNDEIPMTFNEKIIRIQNMENLLDKIKEKQAVEKGLMKRYLMNTKSRQYNINRNLQKSAQNKPENDMSEETKIKYKKLLEDGYRIPCVICCVNLGYIKYTSCCGQPMHGHCQTEKIQNCPFCRDEKYKLITEVLYPDRAFTLEKLD
ncbi:protein kinase domain protein [Ichthyophthirius multifiliis]|uniref:Protein kinase domain protein n=1 Tax=Ichthyophthirius multifiliis TaxID=5932 RepID=G0QP74_ICHMU|nr:protein kinase domain protein [Ichthyophthirius multifiliis]EGR32983.1 protein kinase domain protein [Ichthyophthirius multifiliis]|eukprot:XP_004036969.1 protein kinase domain protein [Ichthyophthirius multifiliis]